jgi:phage shock protein A
MNIFSRITASVNASLDKAVSKVENHEAIVDAALKETRAAAAKARIRYTRVMKDGENLRAKLEQLTKMEATWTERAKQVVEEDENKALQCVQKRNECQAQIEQTRTALQSHQQLESNIAGSIQQIEQRLQKLTQQRNMMRSRHSTADAMRIVNQIENNSGVLVDDALERWEIAITETEYLNNPDYIPGQEFDALDDSFKQVENTASLKADLDLILANKDQSSSN